MSIEAELAAQGFDLVQEWRGGSRRFARRVHPYLVFWLTAFRDGTGELSWEFALGEYLKAKGLTVSAQDELSLLLFPAHEIRGTIEEDWLRERVAEAEAQLGSLDFAGGT